MEKYTAAQINLFEHCRYKIYSHYFGVCELKRVIAIADNLDDCRTIIGALELKYINRPFVFSYELIAVFDPIKDTDISFPIA